MSSNHSCQSATSYNQVVICFHYVTAETSLFKTILNYFLGQIVAASSQLRIAQTGAAC